MLCSSFFWARMEFGSIAEPPGKQRDDVYYENIAFNLAAGNGFALDFASEDWRQPYRDANRDGSNEWIFRIKAAGPTATRPPVWPILMAGSYQLCGRRFDVLRWMNIGSVSIGLTLLLCTLFRFYGPATAIMAAITISLDFAVMRTAGQLMTEAIAIAWMAILFSIGARMFFTRDNSGRGRHHAWQWAILGITLGLYSMIRTNAIGWICLAVVFGAAYCVFKMLKHQDWKSVIVRLSCLLLGVAIVAGPWWARNCFVTGHFQPFGTAAGIGVAGFYSDRAFEGGGIWDLDAVHQAQQNAFENHDVAGLTLAQQEYLIGIEGRRLAGDWIAENPGKLPQLFLIRIGDHLGILSGFHPALIGVNLLILFGALIGMIFDRQWGRWIAVVWLLSLMVTVLTISHQGRYSIPIRPLLHVACAIGTVWFWTMVWRYFSPPQRTEPRPE